MPVRRTEVHPTPAANDWLAQDATWLREVLRRALGCSLASSLWLAGCAQTHDAQLGGLDSSGSASGLPGSRVAAPPTCSAGIWDLAASFSLAIEVDYIADRGYGGAIVSENGVACATASDRSTCQMEAAEPSAHGRDLLTTQGDSVRVWYTGVVPQLLGDVDTTAEAIWWLLARGYDVPCDTRITYASGKFEIDADQRCGRGLRTYVVDADGNISGPGCPPVVATPGRRPAGLLSCHRPRNASRLGEHFAAMAHMEAASVPAFAAIARELRCHGAPDALIAAAERARRDEVRHARVAAGLARRFGARASWPVVTRTPVRGLDAFALDNAVEGCVNETYAAAEASYQAARANDPLIRRAMRAIATDETRHAALSWQIARWVTPQLDRATRARIAAAQHAAVMRLGLAVHAGADADLCARAGLPDPNAARALHASLARELWRV